MEAVPERLNILNVDAFIRGKVATAYNENNDLFTVQLVAGQLIITKVYTAGEDRYV